MKRIIIKGLKPIFQNNGLDKDGKDLILYVQEKIGNNYVVALHENWRFGDLKFKIAKTLVKEI